MMQNNEDVPVNWLRTLILSPCPEALFSLYAFVFEASEQLKVNQLIYSGILKNNIRTRQIPFPELLVLLKGAIRQTDPRLKESWIKLIVNTLDQEKNIQTHSYPSTLTQLSLNELEILRYIKKETAVDLRWEVFECMNVSEAEIINLEHHRLIHQNSNYTVDIDESQLRRSNRITPRIRIQYDRQYRLTAFAELLLESML